MSEPKPSSPAPTDNGQPAKPAGPAVIRQFSGAEESDRLMKKHLPAWVVSGGVHLLLILLAWLVVGTKVPEVKANPDALATSVETPEEPEKDLTNDDAGLESQLTAALPLDRIEDKTVEALVTQDPIGVPNTDLTDPNATAPPGLNLSDNLIPGVDGDKGDRLKGTGGAGGNTNAAFLGRSGSTKEKLLREGGGNSDSELAVAKGLAWLARQQKADGSWRFDGTAKDDVIAATGLALLPFLAAGETHRKGGRYQQHVKKGLEFLVTNLNASTGKFNSRATNYMYGHGIATMALCEAYGMTKDKAFLQRPCQAAINLIVAVQGPNDGWRYPAAPVAGDLSVTGWQIQALQAARLSKDIVVPDSTVTRSNKYLDAMSSGSRKATYGYTDSKGGPGTAMTAVGLLCRYYFSNWGPHNGGMSEGVAGLTKNGPRPTEPLGNRGGDIYYYYYATQVVHFYGGKEWKDWNEGELKDGKRTGGMRDWLVKLQVRNGADMGSWDPDRGSVGGSGGRLGTTCLCLLTLEVYYRHLPLYKRDGGGENLK